MDELSDRKGYKITADEIFREPKLTTNMTESEPEITFSSLGQTIEADGHHFRVEIYRSANSGWILEVVDESNASTVWDDPFKSDVAALEEFKRTLREEGVKAILEAPAAGDF